MFKDEKIRRELVESVYKELFTNCQWRTDSDEARECERKQELSNNIANVFGIAPLSYVHTENCFTRFMSDAGRLFHLTFNKRQNRVYLGEFSPGLTRPIHKKSKRGWSELIFRSMADILSKKEDNDQYQLLLSLALKKKFIDI